MASSSSAVQSLTSETMPGTRQNSPLDNSSQYQSGPDHSLIFHSTGAKAESKGIKTTASADHTPSLEKRLSHPLPNHTSTTNHDALHSNIPGSGVLDFSSQKKSKNSSADKGKHKRKGSFSAQGQETVLTRKKRAPRGAICVRCKIFREKCSGSFPCERCKQVTVTKWQSICVRANLTELSCYKKSLFGHRLQMHLDNVREWKASAKFKPVRIIVSAGYKPVLPLTVHEFVPIDVRLLDHMSWRVHSTDEMIRRPSPPWGLYNVVLEPSQINHFMDEMVEELLDEKTFRQKDAIWVHTFLSALNRSKSMRQDAKLLQNVLRMWAAQSLWFDRIWRVVSEGEKIKSRWQDFLNGHDVPRLLYVQLDFYMEAYIAHLETRILADLNDFIFSRSSSTWFSVYAAAFVYLVALENDSWRLETWKAKLKKWENLSSDVRSNLPAWPLPNNPNYYLEQNRYNARVVAGHIRAGCKGLFPFSMRSSGQVVANTQKTDPEIEGFVDSIQEEFNGFGQKMMLRRLVPSFRAEDVDSLDYTFVASILMDIE
ncbi:hypothetical protein F5884DRAFT_491771 [Xylogone sp. PMI_703]|nr:hypothetical protein F5884DRAFT_491771 [Xylogone sp. PMI_703]